MPAGNELWQVQWQPGVYAMKPIVKKGNVVSQVVKEESRNWRIDFNITKKIIFDKIIFDCLFLTLVKLAKAYVPPHLRGKVNSSAAASNFKSKLHDDDEKPDKSLKIKPSDAVLDTEKKIKNLKKVKSFRLFK